MPMETMAPANMLVNSELLAEVSEKALSMRDKDLRGRLKALRDKMSKATKGLNTAEGWQLQDKEVVEVLGDGPDSDKMGKFVDLHTECSALVDEVNRRVAVKRQAEEALSAEREVDGLITGLPNGEVTNMVDAVNRHLRENGISGRQMINQGYVETGYSAVQLVNAVSNSFQTNVDAAAPEPS